MNNIIRRRTKPAHKRCAFTGYQPQKMPFGYDEADPRCIELKAHLRALGMTCSRPRRCWN